MRYEDLESQDLQTMDGGALDSTFRSLIALSIENSVEAEAVQKRLSILESEYALTEEPEAKKPLRSQIVSLKREEKINSIRAKAIDKLASRLQTLLRTFGK